MPPKPAPMTPLSQRLRKLSEDLMGGPMDDVSLCAADDLDAAADRLDALAALRPRLEAVFADDIASTDPPCDGDAEGLCYQCARVRVVRDLLALLPEEGR